MAAKRNMSRLVLQFLGTPEVRHAEQLLKFPTRKTLALLIYLATAGGMQARERLTALFWPESDERQGRAILRNTLTYLRRLLDDQSNPHLLIERDALGFDFGSDFELDLHHVTAAVHAGPDQMALLKTAVAHYRGDFLAGFSLNEAPEFDAWAMMQREQWHHQIHHICDRLAAWQTATGDVAGATDTLQRWLAINPLHEEIYRRLMHLYLAAGNPEAARRTYEACRAMLATEFGTEPSPETAALARQVAGGRWQVATDLAPNYAAPPAPPLPLSPAPLLPLIGRTQEYLALVESFHQARSGRPQWVSLEGESGIGKSRLADEFLTWAMALGADVVRGRAFEMGGRLPYQSISEALRRRLEQENAPEDLLADVWLVELSRILPELRERYPDLPWPAGDDATARTRLFEAVARLGLALAARKPSIFFIDDIQWADLTSLDLLRYVAYRWKESSAPLMLLVAARAENIQSAADLSGWLTDPGHLGALLRLSLRPLTLDETRHLVSTLTRDDLSHLFGDWLFQQTEGYPLFIVETLKSLAERQVVFLEPQPGGHLALHIQAAELDLQRLPDFLPPGVRDVIRARLAHLSGQGFAMLTAGAVLGQEFTFERLCQVAGLEEQAGLPALEELLARRLFQPLPVDEDTEGIFSHTRYLFTHDKIRDVAYTEAGAARRRLLHRRALEVLEQAGAAPAALAYHAIVAAQPQAAFRYSLAAGDAAFHLFAVRDAIAHYEQAHLAGKQWMPSSGEWPVEWQHLYTQLGRAYELDSQLPQARAIYENLLQLGRRLGQTVVICLALNRLATVVAQDDLNLEQSRIYLREAASLARASDDKISLAETEWNLAQMAVYSSQPRAVVQHGTQALALARELDLPELIARSLNVLALGYIDMGGWEKAESLASEAASRFAALGDRALEADCLGLVANTLIFSGRLQEGVALGWKAFHIAREINSPWGQVSAVIQMVPGLLDGGDTAVALDLTQEAVALTRQHHIAPLLPYILVYQGVAQRELGDLEAAQDSHLAALTADDAMPMHPFAQLIHAELCADYARAGEWERAYTHARQALARRSDDLVVISFVHDDQTEALLRGGDEQLARDGVARLGRLLENPDYLNHNPRFRIPYLRCLATVAKWDGDGESAVAYLEAALQLAIELGLPGEERSIREKLA